MNEMPTYANEQVAAGLGIGIIFAAILVGVMMTGLWLWSLIHCIRNKHLADSNRIIGIVLIVVLGLIGSLIYLFLPREQEPQR